MQIKSWLKTSQGRRVLASSLAGLAALAAFGAVGVFAYPYYTNMRAGGVQKDLKETFASPAIKQAFVQRKLVDGSPLTRIKIPTIGTDHLVVEGTSIKALNTGAGHYPGTPLPGEKGNVAIAGHRTMYGQPFNKLDRIRAGDKIFLTTPFARYTYEVIPTWQGQSMPFIVSRFDWGPIREVTDEHMLTLTTCNPLGKATNRLVAKAKMISKEPITTTKA